MSDSLEIVEEYKIEIARKKQQLNNLLDQLALIDLKLDKYDGVIGPIDQSTLPLSNEVNGTVDSVKAAYEARIAAGCRTDLKWVLVGTTTQLIDQGGAPVPQEVEIWEVQKNSDTYDYKPKVGLKYYKKPLDRDYGSTLVSEFYANVSAGSNVIAITNESGNPTITPPEIKINDTISDDIDNPLIFSFGNLPEVVGFGTTTSVGVVTTLVGGISTGSTIFNSFGAGSLSGISTGMTLVHLGVGTDLPVLPPFTTIVGFGTTSQNIEYFDGNGVLLTSLLTSNTLILSSSATDYIEEGQFVVGILTNYTAIFLSTEASRSGLTTDLVALRVSSDIYKGFDYTKSPNSPIKIGIIDATNVGTGGSVYFDESGIVNGFDKYKPGKTYVDGTKENRNDCLYKSDGTLRPNTVWNQNTRECIRNVEPDVGAGRGDYYIGTTQWPTITSSNGGDPPIFTTSYASEGTRVTIASTATGVIGYAAGPPPLGVFPGNCSTFDTAINNALNTYTNTRSRVVPDIQSKATMGQTLRKQREKLQRYAWSILQSASKLDEEIEELESVISDISNFDFTPYE
jgi:hypothetical protein